MRQTATLALLAETVMLVIIAKMPAIRQSNKYKNNNKVKLFIQPEPGHTANLSVRVIIGTSLTFSLVKSYEFPQIRA